MNTPDNQTYIANNMNAELGRTALASFEEETKHCT